MTTDTAEVYRRWAEYEARGVSPTYFDWATGVADSPPTLALIASLPRTKWQPNLVFAAARAAGAPVGGVSDFIEWLSHNWELVEPIIQSRSTQTNEAGRCAVLLPALAEIDAPLALIEAGASAGLCLYPDRYSYRYTDGESLFALDPPSGSSSVMLPCSIQHAPAPSRIPEVAWRAGIDLNPIDLTDSEQIAWLETLVWPEHEERRARLLEASRIAATDPPHLVQGDIIERIPQLVNEAPAGSRVVVFHSAVLVYLTPERRAAFVDLVTSLPNVTWVSNEGAGVLPEVTAQVSEPIRGRTIVAVDGRATALVGPHGQSYQAIHPRHKAPRAETLNRKPLPRN